jgi:hypothetical protein
MIVLIRQMCPEFKREQTVKPEYYYNRITGGATFKETPNTN